MLMLLALVITLGASAYATDYTVFDKTNVGTWTTNSAKDGFVCQDGDFQIVTSQGESTNTLLIPDTQYGIRVYKSSEITISSETVTMTKIVITASSNSKYANTMTYSTGWSGSKNSNVYTIENTNGSKSFTAIATGGQTRIEKIVITGEADTVLGEIKYNGQVANGLTLNAFKGDIFTFTTLNAEEMTLTVGETTVNGINSVEWTAPSVEKNTEYTLNLTAKQGTNEKTASVKVIVAPAPTCGTVVFDPAAGEIVKGSFVTITCENATQIKYWFGDDDSSAETLVISNARVAINEACTLHAVGINADGIEGIANEATYTVKIATSATFDFLDEELIKSTCEGMAPSNSQASSDANNLNDKTLTLNGVTITFGNGGGSNNPPRWWSDKNVRLYAGNTLTVSAPENCYITKINITGNLTATSNPAGYNNGVWTPSSSAQVSMMREVAAGAKTVVLTKSGSRQEISKIEVEFNASTGIAGIEAEAGEAVYYNLQGVRVENPVKGLYIRVANGKSQKVIM